VSQAWIAESTKAYSDTGSCGYDFMWWEANNGKSLPRVQLPDGSFWAWGTRGQYFVIIPAWNLVVVHRVNTDVPGRDASHNEFGRLLWLILNAREQRLRKRLPSWNSGGQATSFSIAFARKRNNPAFQYCHAATAGPGKIRCRVMVASFICYFADAETTIYEG
jgi:hypothetical protein